MPQGQIEEIVLQTNIWLALGNGIILLNKQQQQGKPRRATTTMMTIMVSVDAKMAPTISPVVTRSGHRKS